MRPVQMPCGERGIEMDCCPVCGGELEQVKCKVTCKQCKAIVANCNGD